MPSDEDSDGEDWECDGHGAEHDGFGTPPRCSQGVLVVFPWIPTSRGQKLRATRDSNARPSVPETDALSN